MLRGLAKSAMRDSVLSMIETGKHQEIYYIGAGRGLMGEAGIEACAAARVAPLAVRV